MQHYPHLSSHSDTGQFGAAIQALSAISHRGFDSSTTSPELAPVMLGRDRVHAATLIKLAAYMVDEKSQVHYDPDNGALTLKFEKEFPKPPIRAMRYQLEKVQDEMLSCIELQDNGKYLVRQHPELPLDVVEFMSHFAPQDHAIESYYALPPKTIFVDSEGMRHQGSVPGDVMDQFLTKHPEFNIPSSSAISCSFALIDAETMQRAMKEMGVSTAAQGRAN